MDKYTDKYGVIFRDEGKTLDRCPLDITGQYIIPEGTISIGSNAFANCWDLESVIIPRSVAYIGGFAFNRCKNLKAIFILSDKLNEIGISCFRCCDWLTIVARPDIIRQISNYNFIDSNITFINFSINALTGEYTFDGCKKWESKFIKKYLPKLPINTDDNCSLDEKKDVYCESEESSKSENIPDMQIAPEDNCSLDEDEDVYYESDVSPINELMRHIDDLDDVQLALLGKKRSEKTIKSANSPDMQIFPENTRLEEREDVCYELEETPLDVLMQHIDDLDDVQLALLRKMRPQKSNESENSPSMHRPLIGDDWLPF